MSAVQYLHRFALLNDIQSISLNGTIEWTQTESKFKKWVICENREHGDDETPYHVIDIEHHDPRWKQRFVCCAKPGCPNYRVTKLYAPCPDCETTMEKRPYEKHKIAEDMFIVKETKEIKRGWRRRFYCPKCKKDHGECWPEKVTGIVGIPRAPGSIIAQTIDHFNPPLASSYRSWAPKYSTAFEPSRLYKREDVCANEEHTRVPMTLPANKSGLVPNQRRIICGGTTKLAFGKTDCKAQLLTDWNLASNYCPKCMASKEKKEATMSISEGYDFKQKVWTRNEHDEYVLAFAAYRVCLTCRHKSLDGYRLAEKVLKSPRLSSSDSSASPEQETPRFFAGSFEESPEPFPAVVPSTEKPDPLPSHGQYLTAHHALPIRSRSADPPHHPHSQPQPQPQPYQHQYQHQLQTPEYQGAHHHQNKWPSSEPELAAAPQHQASHQHHDLYPDLPAAGPIHTVTFPDQRTARIHRVPPKKNRTDPYPLSREDIAHHQQRRHTYRAPRDA